MRSVCRLGTVFASSTRQVPECGYLGQAPGRLDYIIPAVSRQSGSAVSCRHLESISDCSPRASLARSAQGGPPFERRGDLQETSWRNELPSSPSFWGVGSVSFISWASRGMCQLLHFVQLLSHLFLTRAERSAAGHRTQADPVASAFAWARGELAKWRDRECN
eukprot:1593371-Pyramimonas_sp.AAC.2